MITLTINAANAEELVTHVKGLQSHLLSHLEVTGQHVQAHVGQGATPSEPKKEETKKARASTAKDKVVTSQVAETPSETTTTTAASENSNSSAATVDSGTKTKEDVANALQNLTAAKDIAKAKEVLARFNNAGGTACARLSDIQQKDYEDFVATCEAESK